MLLRACENCGKDKYIYPSALKRAAIFFCNKQCHRVYKNRTNNPSKNRDLSGANNPMFGKHPQAWNKGLTGELSHNWKGGVHKRKDGYYRIRVDGKRYLLHRHLLKEKLDEHKVIHHRDGNPSNNSVENLEILENQAEHARLHAKISNTTRSSEDDSC